MDKIQDERIVYEDKFVTLSNKTLEIESFHFTLGSKTSAPSFVKRLRSRWLMCGDSRTVANSALATSKWRQSGK